MADRRMPGLTVILLAAALPAQQPAAAFDLDAAFEAAVPPPAESLWTRIPWRLSLTDALAEAKRVHQPVFLYANDGDVGSGRC